MNTLLATLALLPSLGLLSLLMKPGRWAAQVGAWGGAALCVLALGPVVRVLAGGAPVRFDAPWQVPGGSFSVALDPLSAVFLAPMLVLAAAGAVYGRAYMAHRPGGCPRSHWLYYNGLVSAMLLVVLARNALLFLVAWEVMALASYFLVTTDDAREDVRDAGWTYLVATHLGTAFLFGLFALLGNRAGSLDFADFEALAGLPHGVAAAAFLLALVGFGAKAGLVPFHVWLPEAHPAAPSHVSALMSGAMIKTGVYGLVRILGFLGPPPPWWGWTLIAAGLVSGLGGILFALAQHDLKRLLAYSSVENVGIVGLGLGTGLLGLSMGVPQVAALGFAGALVHVVNHGLIKGLLFLCAGAVIHATGTGQIDRLGGLIKGMPRTGLAFLVAAAAIAGLPPLNGFAGEFLIFLAGLRGAASFEGAFAVPLAGAVAGLALVSGLAAACFAKAFGIAFLGEPRQAPTAPVHDPGPDMTLALAALAVACVVLGVLAPWAPGVALPAVGVAAGMPATAGGLNEAAAVFLGVTVAFAGTWVLAGLLAWARHRLLAGRSVEDGMTWDCGYAAPTARMQYTGSSFSQPLVHLFGTLLRTRRHVRAPLGLFPKTGAFDSTTPDLCREAFYAPLFRGSGRALLGLRRLQHGNLHLYVLYIALTMLVLLVWKLG